MFVGAILLRHDLHNGGHRDEHLYLAVSSDSSPIVVAQTQTDTTGSASQYADLTSTEYLNVSGSLSYQAHNNQGHSGETTA